MDSLKERLKDWQDIDFAQHELAISLGLTPQGSLMWDYKARYWSNNELVLHLIIT